MKMRSLNLIIKNVFSNAMAKFGFGHQFHDRKFLKAGFFLHIL